MKLKEARFKKNMTQGDIHRLTGIHISKISLIENGYHAPTDTEKAKIAKALSCKVSEIIY